MVIQQLTSTDNSQWPRFILSSSTAELLTKEGSLLPLLWLSNAMYLLNIEIVLQSQDRDRNMAQNTHNT